MKKMKRLKAISFLVIYLLTATSIMSQGISGIVNDQDNNPIEFANVILYQQDSNNAIAVKTTDSTGYYEFLNLDTDSYVIEISVIGFNSIKSDTLNLNNNNKMTFDTKLEAAAYTTEGVVVTAKRPKIIHRGGKTIVDLEQTLNNGSNVLGVLKKLPSVIVSKSSITVGGQTATKILINGRNTNYLDVQNLLSNMNGENIVKVEIIYQPDATLEASGSGPILNIILKKNKLKGTNGYINGMVGKSESFIFSNGFGISTFKKNISFSANGSYRSYNWTENNAVNRQVGSEYFEQSSINNFVPKTLSFNANLDFYLSSKHTIGTDVQYQNHTDNWEGTSSILRNNNADVDELNTQLFTNEKSNFVSINPYNEWKWDDGFLRFDIRYLQYLSEEDNRFKQQGESTLGLNIPSFKQAGDNFTWSYKVDFLKTLNETHRLKSGIQYDIANLDNQINHFQIVNGSPEPNSELDNQFLIDEKITAAYTQYGYEKDEIELNAGLRWEYSKTVGQSTRVDSTAKRTINRFFPSFSISTPLFGDFSGNFSYSYRLNRPTYSSLNPFRIFYDPLFSDSGNPQLLPEFIHSSQFRLLKDGEQLLRVAYSTKSNAFFERIFQNDLSGETNRQLINLDSYHYLGVSVYFPVNYSSFAYGDFSISTRYQNFNSTTPGFPYTNYKWSIVGSHDFEIELPKKITMEGSLWAGSGRLNGMMETDWYAGGYLEFSRSFFEEKLRVSLELEDIINRGFVHNTSHENINMTVSNSWNFFNLYLRMRYSFGQKFTKGNDNKRDSDGLERF